MGKYMLENIHVAFPQARLGIVVGSRALMVRDLFAAYPWLEVLEAHRKSPFSLLSLFRNFYRSDLIVTQYAGKQGGTFSLPSKLFARLLAKRGGLIGFTDLSRWNFLYDRLVPVRPDLTTAEHEREALQAAGLQVPLRFPMLEYIKDDAVLQKFGLEAGKFIVVHLFAGNTKRGLHPEKKRELLVALSQKFPHTQLIVSGGADDRKEALRVTKELSIKVIAGEATLQEMMNLIAQSRWVISVDTGMAHIAAQLRIPLTVLRTCLARNWWIPGQYGEDAPITVLSHDESCTAEHISKDYPDCINAVLLESIVRS